MEIFLSWSGNSSHSVAQALRDWIPCVFQSTQPWLSSADIVPGERWSIELSQKLQTIEFSILCLSQENLESPWMLFEAGALSKSLDRARVVPYLIDLPSSRLSDPLAQFQAVQADHLGTKSLVSALAAANPNNFRDVRMLEMVFDKWWPELDRTLAKIRTENQSNKLRANDVTVLTSRDIEILRLLAAEASDIDISHKLQLSRGTVRSHISRIFSKLGVSSGTEAVSMAIRLDLIE